MMLKGRYKGLEEKIDHALKERSGRTALYRAMKRGRDSRHKAVGALPGGEGFRNAVRSVKVRCLNQQDELVDRFARKVRERGARVFMANDGPEAISYILDIVKKRGARTVAKSKSLTSEEIEVNHPLEEAGVDVIETDLGELIIQKVNEKPFHLVFPAVHKTAVEVAEIFREVTQQDVPHDVDAIMRIVRKYLRPIFLNADIGMTGANVGVAETGAIVIETNEGNARLVSSIPDVHICIMGREKIVDTVEDALQMMLAHPISAVGQHLTTYVTMMAGRSPLGAGDGRGPRESHIIILDNGRSRMREDPLFKDALNCIRCGACMNICPTYGVVGGHTFGYIYPGPIGIPWTSEVHGLDKAAEFAPLCVSCGLCKEICPAGIDIPMMIAGVKDRDGAQNGHPRVNRILMAAEGMAKFGCATAPFSNWMMRNGLFRWAMEAFTGIDRRRALPPFRRQTLPKWFRRRGAVNWSKEPVRQAVFFADIYAAYNAPELGRAAVSALEALGCEVILPRQRGSGYPYIGYGDLKRAEKLADENVRLMMPHVEAGYDVVATEPTAAYCLKVSYPKLLHGRADAQAVADRTYELFAYLEMLENLAGGGEETTLYEGRRFGFHVSCHQRPLDAGRQAMDYLRRRGAEVELVETGTCCGMAGTFGMKKGMLGYELSQAVGEPLFQAFQEANVDTIVTESSVCAIHLREGTGIKVIHPLELLMEQGGTG
ncbi:MAG: LUD domain-containing protein [Gemmatimonadota bacterium]|nr:LUD domain-containing protein [Gemmatimonadota bacterium]